MKFRRMAAAFWGVACLILSGLPQAAVAEQREIPKTVDELLTIYGIADMPSDYVVVVDTSGSMEFAPPLYPEVKAAYLDFIKAIGKNDHLSVVTFDTNTTIRFSGAQTDAASQAAAEKALPDRAVGKNTDIGEAINVALGRLERADSSQVQTLIFLTDGKIDAPRSDYRTPGSAAWTKLSQRAAQQSSGHTLSVYGAGFGDGETDIDVMKSVFPQAVTVRVARGQLKAFFADAVRKARVQKLRAPVTQELKRYPLQPVVTSKTLGDTTRLQVAITSKLPNLGATVSVRGVSVEDASGAKLQATLVKGAQSITLKPGETSAPIEVDVKVPNLNHTLKFGQVPESRDLRLTLDMTTEAEPAGILTKDLALNVAPGFVAPNVVTAERMRGIAWWMVGVAVVAFLIFLRILLWAYRRFIGTPRLRGYLRFDDGREDVRLAGKEAVVPQGGDNTVRLFTKPRSFDSPIFTSSPKIWVERKDGDVSVQTGGRTRGITLARELIPADRLDFGSTRARLFIRKQKGSK